MKKSIYKYLILTFIAFNFSNCNDDDDITFDPIIGSWKQISIVQNGVEYYQQNNCLDNSSVSFSVDGSVTESFYYKENGICKEELMITVGVT